MKHLKLTDLQPTTEEFPCLRHVKGAQIRAFAPVCLELCRLYKDSRVDKHRLAMVSSLNQLYTLMGEHSWKKMVRKAGEQFLAATNTLLSHYSIRRPHMLWEGRRHSDPQAMIAVKRISLKKVRKDHNEEKG